MNDKILCAACSAECIPNGCTTGCGTAPDGRKLCFPCCAAEERQSMIANGAATLYLVPASIGNAPEYKVQNWTGHLSFEVWDVARGPCAVFGRRYRAVYVRFRGPDGKMWRGRHVDSGAHDLINVKRVG